MSTRSGRPYAGNNNNNNNNNNEENETTLVRTGSSTNSDRAPQTTIDTSTTGVSNSADSTDNGAVANTDISASASTVNNAAAYVAVTHPFANFSLRTFSGNYDEDIGPWLKEIIYYKNLYRWSEAQTIGAIVQHLQGRCKQWFFLNHSNQQPVLDDLINRLNENFSIKISAAAATKLISSRVHKPGEPVMTYIDNLLFLIGKYDNGLSESKKVAAIFNGLQPSMARHISLSVDLDTVNVQQIIDICRRFEQVELSFDTTVPQSQVNVLELIMKNNQEIMKNNQETLDRVCAMFASNIHNYPNKTASKNEWTNDGKPICRYCKESGHILQNCPELAKKNSRTDRRNPRNNNRPNYPRKQYNNRTNAINNEYESENDNAAEN